jgi:hypothetical protein
MNAHLARAAAAVVVLACSRFCSAQPAESPRTPRGPWDHDLVIYDWRGGAEPDRGRVLVERGGVPHLLRDQWGRLVASFQWFPLDRRDSFDRVAVMFSYDDGRTWGRPQAIEVDGMPRGFNRPCDPTLVQLDDGRYRLYFTAAPREESPATYSAISSDGVRYTFEPGLRFGVEGEPVLDCAVARLGETWHYFAPVQADRGRGYHAVSRDGLDFRRVEDVTVAGERQWLGCAVAAADGLRFFGSGRDGIWSAMSPDGVDWRLEPNARIGGADPGVVVIDASRTLIIATGPLRRDAGTARLPFDSGPPPAPVELRRDRGQGSNSANRPTSLAMLWSRGREQGRGPVRLNNFPLRVEDIASICPMGLMVGGHVTPSDHLGVAPKRQGERAADVIAMANGFIVDIQRSMPGNPDPAARGRDAGTHRLVFEHSGTFYSYIGLVDELADHVLDAAGGEVRPGPPIGLRLPVKAGEVVGRLTGDHGLDFAVMNTEVSLAGFAVPERFQMRDMWKIHTVDPYDYIDEPMRGRLLALNPRQAKPLGGKIDYDVDGRLVGNWYREGSGGYAARRGQLDYWVGHLAIVYHHIDPTKVTVSVGDWQGRPRQFWVAGNTPDPATISTQSGPVKYELVWPRLGSAGNTFELPDPDRVHGVLLAELTSQRTLRVELFVGKRAEEVDGFTDAAVNYER